MTLTHITLEHVRDDWGACYEPDRLAELFPEPRTPYEVLTREDGPWADVPPEDRLWVVLRPEVIPDDALHLLACDFAESVLLREREAGREPDERSRAAIETKRRWVRGEATDEELYKAARAAREAARSEWAVRVLVWSASLGAKAWEASQAASWAEDVGVEQIRRVIEVMGWEPKEGGDE